MNVRRVVGFDTSYRYDQSLAMSRPLLVVYQLASDAQNRSATLFDAFGESARLAHDHLCYIESGKPEALSSVGDSESCTPTPYKLCRGVLFCLLSKQFL